MDKSPWNEDTCLQVLKLQDRLSKATNYHQSIAIEAALDSLLAKFQEGTSLTDPQINGMIRNRKRVSYRREELVKTFHNPKNMESPTEAIVTIKQLAEKSDPFVFSVIIGNAAGYSYNELASKTGLSTSNLKTKVHRERIKLQRLAA